MTLNHLLRTAAVAGLATLLLAAIQQAHAEGGDDSTIYAAASVDRSRQVEEATMADESAAVDEAASAEQPHPSGPKGAIRRIAARVPAATGPGADLKSMVLHYASQNDLPFGLADAVIRLESRYNPKVRNGLHVGLTQIDARTAQSLGYQGAPDGLLDPETNLRYGLRYLGRAYKLAGGDTCGTILRFQAGHRAETMTRAARSYCAKVQTLLVSAE